ncbi:hypothetical protein BKA80DRAFT_117485 [Phyllosticta citrichinensis]
MDPRAPSGNFRTSSTAISAPLEAISTMLFLPGDCGCCSGDAIPTSTCGRWVCRGLSKAPGKSLGSNRAPWLSFPQSLEHVLRFSPRQGPSIVGQQPGSPAAVRYLKGACLRSRRQACWHVVRKANLFKSTSPKKTQRTGKRSIELLMSKAKYDARCNGAPERALRASQRLRFSFRHSI